MVIGTAIVPVMDAIAKSLSSSLSPLLITWGRFFFQFLVMVLPILHVLGVRGLVPSRPGVQAIRGLLLAAATACFFFALRYLPLADTIAVFFVQPMLLTILSALFLGEQIGWARRVAVVVGFAGTLFIIKPGSADFTLAYVLPLCAALFFACYLAVTRAVANVDHPMTMQFASGAASAVVLGVALWFAYLLADNPFVPTMPTLREWAWLGLIGLIAAVCHLLVVMGLNRAPASLLAPFGYIEIVAATTLGWLLFDDWPDAFTWFGISIIVASGCFVFYRERRQELQKTASASAARTNH